MITMLKDTVIFKLCNKILQAIINTQWFFMIAALNYTTNVFAPPK